MDGSRSTSSWDPGWTWFDLGLPTTVSSISDPKAISWVAFGVEALLVFTAANDGRLFVDAWDSNNLEWTWLDLGLGLGTEPVRNPTPISYVNEFGVMQILVFAEGSNGQLLVDVWDGTSWTWYDLGQP